MCGDTAAHLLGFSFDDDTQVRLRSCISDENFIRNSVVSRDKLAADVDAGCSLRHDRLRACLTDAILQARVSKDVSV